MSFWQEIEINQQQSVDQDLQLTEPRWLILSDPQAEAGGDSFLSWDDLIGQADSLCPDEGEIFTTSGVSP